MKEKKNMIFRIRNHSLIMRIPAAAAVAGAMLSNMAIAFADPNQNKIFQNTITNVVQMITNIAMGVGIILIAIGVIQLLLSLLRDDGERQANATKFIVVGIALLAINGFLKAIGVTSTEFINNLSLWNSASN